MVAKIIFFCHLVLKGYFVLISMKKAQPISFFSSKHNNKFATWENENSPFLEKKIYWLYGLKTYRVC